MSDRIKEINNYGYDDNSNCTSINGTEYGYDGLNRLTSVKFSGGTISYSYRKDSKLSEVEYPNGMTTTYDYDEVGRLISKQTTLGNGTVVAGYSYQLDKVGNITEQTTACVPSRSLFVLSLGFHEQLIGLTILQLVGNVNFETNIAVVGTTNALSIQKDVGSQHDTFEIEQNAFTSFRSIWRDGLFIPPRTYFFKTAC